MDALTTCEQAKEAICKLRNVSKNVESKKNHLLISNKEITCAAPEKGHKSNANSGTVNSINTADTNILSSTSHLSNVSKIIKNQTNSNEDNKQTENDHYIEDKKMKQRSIKLSSYSLTDLVTKLQSNAIQVYTKETETNTERLLHRNEPIENKGILGLDQEKSITKTQTQYVNKKKNILENLINQLKDKVLTQEINHSEQKTQNKANLKEGEQIAIRENQIKIQEQEEKILPNKTKYINTAQTTNESLQGGNITIISTEGITPHKTEPSSEWQVKLLQISEREIEDIEIPEEEIEELILPNEREMKGDKSLDFIAIDYKTLPRARQQTSNIEVKKMNKNYIYCEDSLAKSTSEDNNSTEEDDFHSMNKKPDENIKDPLMCSEFIPNKIVTQEIIDDEKDDNADDDDDDIEIIEIHNSPICIESEKEEEEYCSNNKSQTTASRSKQIITTATATVILSKNITVTRTNAKKSTCKNQSLAIPSSNCYKIQKRNSHNKNKTPRILRAAAVVKTKVVDIIDLLDDSSDENVIVQVPTMLKKRKLLNTSLSKTKLLRERFPKNLQNSLVKPHVPKVTAFLPKPTPQSNFLNAVQLQPITSIATDNPPAFSALLSNRSVIIPNAFYGNPPGLRTTHQTEKLCIRWLRHFVQQFANRQLLASHSCFVLLQRALKYKDFIRIKTHRVNLNTHAQNTRQNTDWKLLGDLTSILFQTENDLTLHGKRFCEFTCSYREKPHKAITLMTHGTSGCVTLRTWHIDDDIEEIPHISLPTTRLSILNKIHTALVTTVASATTATTITTLTQSMSSKRKRYATNDDEEDEYVPCVPILMQQQQTESYREERKRSLRSKRTKRLDKNFSYNEDLMEIDLNIDKETHDGGEVEALAEIQHKVEQKRLEAKLQRERQAKSFESAFIQAFAKSGNYATTSTTSAFNSLSKALDKKDTDTKRIRLNFKDSLTVHDQYAASNDAEDLLKATWIENVDNIETQTISDEDNENDFDYVQEHYISRMPVSKITAKKSMRKNLLHGNYAKVVHSLKTTVMQRQLEGEFISSNDSSLDGLTDEPPTNNSNKDSSKWPKNIDPEMSVHHSYKYSFCIICKMIAQRIVNHYINVHPGSEVYTSRLSTTQVQQLKTNVINLAHVKSYKNSQLQYEADCVFCQKRCRFLLLYWYQHFSMHTGEYAYRCKNCNIRKPTRSLLTHYHSRACPKTSFIVQDYHYNTAQPDIVASICTLCNYLQLHRDNIIKHLQNQHNIQHILPRHIQEIVLLRRQLSDDVTEVRGNNMNSGTRRNAKDFANNKEPDCHLDRRDTVGEDDNPSSSSGSIQLPVAQQQNKYYNYMPPYLENATHIPSWDNANDAHEDLSYMICDMLDVEINNE